MGVVSMLLVASYALLSTILSEIITYFLVYRTEPYKRKHDELEAALDRLERARLAAGEASASKREEKQKQLASMEKECKKLAGELSGQKFWTGALASVALFVLYWAARSVFDTAGEVATLPFHPPWPISSLTKIGLAKDVAATACGFSGVYAMCSAGIRVVVQKLLQPAPARGLPGGASSSGALAGLFDGSTQDEMTRQYQQAMQKNQAKLRAAKRRRMLQ